MRCYHLSLTNSSLSKPCIYKFNDLEDRYESIYVTGFKESGDSCLVETLNHGVFSINLLYEHNAGATIELKSTDVNSFASFGVTNYSPLPIRTEITWEYVFSQAWRGVVDLFTILGVVFVAFYIIRKARRRYEKDLNKFKSIEVSLREALQKKDNPEIERNRPDEKQDMLRLSWLMRFIKGVIPRNKIHTPIITPQITDIYKKGRLYEEIKECHDIVLQFLDSSDNDELFSDAQFKTEKLKLRLKETIKNAEFLKSKLEKLLKPFNPKNVEASGNNDEPDIDEWSTNIADLMRRYVEKINGLKINELDIKNVSKLIRCAEEAYCAYLTFEKQIIRLLCEYRKFDLSCELLDKLWNVALTLGVREEINGVKYPLYFFKDIEGSKVFNKCKDDDVQKSLKARRTFVLVLFYNDIRKSKEEEVMGQCAYIDARAVYRYSPVRDSRGYNTHGSAYKIIAQLMTPGYVDLLEKPLVPRSLADMLWDKYFSQCNDPIIGLRKEPYPAPDKRKSLKNAIEKSFKLKSKSSQKE